MRREQRLDSEDDIGRESVRIIAKNNKGRVRTLSGVYRPQDDEELALDGHARRSLFENEDLRPIYDEFDQRRLEHTYNPTGGPVEWRRKYRMDGTERDLDSEFAEDGEDEDAIRQHVAMIKKQTKKKRRKNKKKQERRQSLKGTEDLLNAAEHIHDEAKQSSMVEDTVHETEKSTENGNESEENDELALLFGYDEEDKVDGIDLKHLNDNLLEYSEVGKDVNIQKESAISVDETLLLQENSAAVSLEQEIDVPHDTALAETEITEMLADEMNFLRSTDEVDTNALLGPDKAHGSESGDESDEESSGKRMRRQRDQCCCVNWMAWVGNGMCHPYKRQQDSGASLP